MDKVSKYFEATALADLFKKGVSFEGKSYMKNLVIPQGSLGNKSLGKLSFLANFCGFNYKFKKER